MRMKYNPFFLQFKDNSKPCHSVSCALVLQRGGGGGGGGFGGGQGDFGGGSGGGGGSGDFDW